MLIGMATAASTALREKVDRHLSEIKDAVLKHGGVSISLFGSVARGEDNSASDIDFLVEFGLDVRPFELLRLGAELEEILGTPVDIGTVASLRAEIRDEVLAEAIRL